MSATFPVPVPSHPGRVPTTLDELTPAFLTAVLTGSGALEAGSVRARAVEPIGGDRGFTGDVVRVHIDYDDLARGGPPSLIAKWPSSDRRLRALAEDAGSYEREVRFYRELAPSLSPLVPRCYYAACEGGPTAEARALRRRRLNRVPHWLLALLARGAFAMRPTGQQSLLLIEDLAPARAGDQRRGGSCGQIRDALRGLGALHGAFSPPVSPAAPPWLDPPGGSWRALVATHRRWAPRFLRVFPDLSPRVRAAFTWVDRHAERTVYRLASPPRTLLHGDYRLDNLLFGAGRLWMLDFGSVASGRAAVDLARLIGSSVGGEVPLRDLVETYREALAAHGGPRCDLDALERDVHLALLLEAYMQPVLWGTSVTVHRGEALFARWCERVLSWVPAPPYDHLL